MVRHSADRLARELVANRQLAADSTRTAAAAAAAAGARSIVVAPGALPAVAHSPAAMVDIVAGLLVAVPMRAADDTDPTCQLEDAIGR
jgi:hypothetical protein